MRIFLEKGEAVRDVLKKTFATEEKDIVLVVPKDSILSEEEGAFMRIAKEMKAKKKRVRVESVDEHVLELATEGGIAGIHPFFGESRGKPIADIVSGGKKKTGGGKGKTKVQIKSKEKTLTEEETQVSVPVIHEPLPRVEVEEERRTPVTHTISSTLSSLETKKGRRLGRMFVRILVLGAALVGIGYGATVFFWSTVQIDLELTKKEWNQNMEMRATKTVSGVTAGSLTIPAEVFTLDKNTTELYPATGRSAVSEKATGKLVVYNEFGVQAQTLVARTRFATPDGKIFRLAKTITIPGAKLQSGKLTPSSIETTVVADGAGPSYNIGSVARLSIPGFQGTSKENGFYGAMPSGAAGGVSGEHAVPTSQDIASAKAKVEETLRAVLVGTVRSSMPDDFTLLDDAIRVVVTKLTVNSSTDAQGNFSVFGAAQMKAIGFRETDVQKALQALAQKDEPTMVFHDVQFTYSTVKPRFDVGDIAFSVASKGTLWTAFDVWDFEKKILGKNVDEARGMIGRIEGVEGGGIRVWPQFGVNKVPSNEKRVTITVE